MPRYSKPADAAKPAKGRSTKAAFPKNVEPRGLKRFGPPPRAAINATTRNIFNTDPKGQAKPWKGDKTR